MVNQKEILPQQEEEAMLQIARKNFLTWNEALQTGDEQKVADLYSENATFLPTVSGKFKKGKEEAAEYFEHFLRKNPSGKIIEEEIQSLGNESYLHSGMYNFEIGPKGKRQIVEARFSYVWKKNEKGEWKIIHHHSSVKPVE